MAVAAAPSDPPSTSSSNSVTPPSLPGPREQPRPSLLVERDELCQPQAASDLLDISSKSGGAQKRKTKRRQLVSCDTCRLRRVKCEKDEGSDQCRQCISKGVTCTDEYVRNKPRTLKRSGKLIEKAKAMYGDGSHVPSSSVEQSHTLDPPDVDRFNGFHGPSDESHSATLPALTYPSGYGAEQTLVSTVLTQTLSNHLVDCFYTATHFQLPAVEWQPFREAYERAGRRSHEMDPPNEFLCHCIEAFGARVSDSPYILGPDGPRLADLKSQRGVDLSRWGRQRDAFCEAMLERAIRTGDRNGSMRIAVEANMSGLILIDRLMQFRHHTRRGGRVFTAALIELMRTISDDHKAGVAVDESTLASVEGGRIFWHVYLTDACRGAVWRTATQMTEYDVERLCPGSRAATFSSIWEGLRVDDPDRLVAAAVQGLFGQLAGCAHGFVNWMISRALNAKDGMAVTDSDARAVRELFYSLDQSEELSGLFKRRVEELLPGGTANFSLWYNQLGLIRALICLNALCVVKEITARSVANAEDGYGFIGGTDCNDWAALRDEASRRTFVGCQEVASMLESMRSTGQIFGAANPFFMQAYGHALLDVPTTEYGGPLNWTLQNKLDTVTLVLDAVKASGWSWGSADADIKELEIAMKRTSLDEGRSNNTVNEISASIDSLGNTLIRGPPTVHTMMNGVRDVSQNPDHEWRNDVHLSGSDGRGGRGNANNHHAAFLQQAPSSQTTSPPPVSATLTNPSVSSEPSTPYVYRPHDSMPEQSASSQGMGKSQMMSNSGDNTHPSYVAHPPSHHPHSNNPHSNPILHSCDPRHDSASRHLASTTAEVMVSIPQSYHQASTVNVTINTANMASYAPHLAAPIVPDQTSASTAQVASHPQPDLRPHSHSHPQSHPHPHSQPVMVDDIGRYGFPAAVPGPGGVVGFGLGGAGWHPGSTGSVFGNTRHSANHDPTSHDHGASGGHAEDMMEEFTARTLDTYEPAYDGFLGLPVAPLATGVSL